MNFSDWITFVSIFLAVLIAVFKFDEWEIILLKRIDKYIKIPLLFLMLSGISAYFQANPHPTWLNFFWIKNGLPSGVWSIIYISLFFTSAYFYWRRFVNSKPSWDLIIKFNDYLNIYEPSKFSSLFRKYERYFFNSKDENAWLPYELILTNLNWWSIAPSYFKEMVYEKPDRFFSMDENVLKTLLTNQLSKLPNSHLSKELELQWNGVNLSQETPILNIFFSSSHDIEEGRERNIVLPTIKEIAEEYFSSPEFIYEDRKLYSLKPSENAYMQVAPIKIILFYYVQIIDCYWHQVFVTKARVSGFHFYLWWTQKLLEFAPIVEDEDVGDDLPNMYLLLVKRMQSNINDWARYIRTEELERLGWASTHFIELASWIISDINEKYQDKVPNSLIQDFVVNHFNQIVSARNYFEDEFTPNLRVLNIRADFLKDAFEKLTDESYYTQEEQKNVGYRWLKAQIPD